jgi:hypothetical protein
MHHRCPQPCGGSGGSRRSGGGSLRVRQSRHLRTRGGSCGSGARRVPPSLHAQAPACVDRGAQVVSTRYRPQRPGGCYPGAGLVAHGKGRRSCPAPSRGRSAPRRSPVTPGAHPAHSRPAGPRAGGSASRRPGLRPERTAGQHVASRYRGYREYGSTAILHILGAGQGASEGQPASVAEGSVAGAAIMPVPAFPLIVCGGLLRSGPARDPSWSGGRLYRCLAVLRRILAYCLDDGS